MIPQCLAWLEREETRNIKWRDVKEIYCYLCMSFFLLWVDLITQCTTWLGNKQTGKFNMKIYKGDLLLLLWEGSNDNLAPFSLPFTLLWIELNANNKYPYFWNYVFVQLAWTLYQQRHIVKEILAHRFTDKEMDDVREEPGCRWKERGMYLSGRMTMSYVCHAQQSDRKSVV